MVGMLSKCLVRWDMKEKESDLERVTKALIIERVLLLRGSVENPIEVSFSFTLLKALWV
jgi:hypothetical protein